MTAPAAPSRASRSRLSLRPVKPASPSPPAAPKAWLSQAPAGLTAAPPPLTLTAPLFRRRTRRVELVATPPPPPPAPVRRPAAVARLLALAHHIQRSVDRGGYEDYAAVARSLSFTRARVSQLMDLLLLAPDLQERVLELQAVDGREPLAERQLRPIVLLPVWSDQRALWRALGLEAVWETSRQPRNSSLALPMACA